MTEMERHIREGILGDIKPVPSARDHLQGSDGLDDELNGKTHHPGTRELSEGGGVSSEVAGTRNYHSTGGATGGDMGNRPE